MASPTRHAWVEPLDAAKSLSAEPHLCLLYSGLSEQHSGRYSFLAWGLQQELTTDRWADIAAIVSADKPWDENLWFGWLGYGMRNDTEQLARGSDSPINAPDSHLMRFRHVLHFDHQARLVQYYRLGAPDERWLEPSSHRTTERSVSELTSPMHKSEYLDIVRGTKERIEAGDFYQANITRKFTGRLANRLGGMPVFSDFCHISPAAYSAYIRTPDIQILSSSPECFLTIDATGHMLSRPIKGSAPRGLSPAEDAHLRAELLDSAKDHAENRMIVDLVRNDLSRVAYAGTVEVTASSELTSYATVHHLISTVTAQKRADVSTVDAIKACFPPGSMTGAPKIAAMEWCAGQEKLERGIYSGAIGYFGGDGSADLSVVIRTLLIQGDRFEFQVGGGIVADSEPESEWMETLIKARGIAKLLGIDESALANL